MVDSTEYASGTGRVSRLRTQLREHDIYGTNYPLSADGETFDASGNLVRRALLAPGSAHVQGIRRQYYDALEQLRAVDDRLTWHSDASNGYTTTTFEEYRYDALGRRIWTRAQAACIGDTDACSPASQLSDVRRIVWDGSEELYEIRHPGADSLTDAALENDVAPDTAAFALTGTNSSGRQDLDAYYGRVAYVAGRTLDQPVEVIRLNYGSRSGVDGTQLGTYFGYHSLVWTPVWSWRGTPDNGGLAAGPPGDTATSTAGTATSRKKVGGATYYVTPPWNDQFTPWGQGFVTSPGWSGSLLEGRADHVGQRYQRNRYYDPETGHFTQEDPIGLAGGLNAYGFASGDPVNYSDPFGLCPDACVIEGGAAVGTGVYVAGIATVAAISALADGHDLADALTAGGDAARAKIGSIVAWARNKQQESHIRGKLENIDAHFDKLAGAGGPGSGDPNDPRNRDKWKKDIQRAINQVREHIDRINGERNKAPWEEALEERVKRLGNTP